MCRYRGTDRLLLSIEIACSCVSTIGKESSGEKHMMMMFVPRGCGVCGAGAIEGARCENAKSFV